MNKEDILENINVIDPSSSAQISVPNSRVSNDNQDVQDRSGAKVDNDDEKVENMTENATKTNEHNQVVVKDRDVSYLAFKAFDTSSISGTPSPRKHSSNNSSHSYGTSGNFVTATSICTLHEVTNKQVTDPSNSNDRADDNSAFISSCSDIRPFSNSNSNTLAPSFSTPTRNDIVDHLHTNEYTITPLNDTIQSPGDENPFQNDRLPIWQNHQQFTIKSYDNKADSDTGSPSTTNSSAISLSYPPHNHNNSTNDVRNPSNLTTTCSSTSPDYSQFDGYNYKQLNETPTSPELLAYRQQQEQYGTNCLQYHYEIPNNKTTKGMTNAIIPNNHNPTVLSPEMSPKSVKTLASPEVNKKFQYIWFINQK